LQDKGRLVVGDKDFSLGIEVDADNARLFAPGGLTVVAEVGAIPVALVVLEIIAAAATIKMPWDLLFFIDGL
jgi:hypothetical protein